MKTRRSRANLETCRRNNSLALSFRSAAAKLFFCVAGPIVARLDRRSSDEQLLSFSLLSMRLTHRVSDRSFLRFVLARLSNVFPLAKRGHRHHAALVASFRPSDDVLHSWRQCVVRLRKGLRSDPSYLPPVRRPRQSFDVNPLSTLSC